MRYPAELRERAVRLVFEQQGQHASRWAALCAIAAQLGCSTETLRNWVGQAERDNPELFGRTTPGERLDELEHENRDLRRQNEILRKVWAFFGVSGDRPPIAMMVAFIDVHGEAYGVESICSVLPITPATYYKHAAHRQRP
jgi:transposase-like protein